MKIFACIKHVPDTAAKIKLTGEDSFDDSDCKFIINPYDEYGLEEAVCLAEKNGGEAVAVTVGKDAAANTLRSALAMGAHRAIHVKTQGQFLDSTLTARAIKAAIKQDGDADLIFAGKGAVDTEGSQTLYRLAAAMDRPVVNEVSGVFFEGRNASVIRECGNGTQEVLVMELPGIIGATKGLNKPRYPKLPDIMKAKKKEIKEIAITDLGIDEAQTMLHLSALEIVPERAQATMIEGALEEQVSELVRLFKNDINII